MSVLKETIKKKLDNSEIKKLQQLYADYQVVYSETGQLTIQLELLTKRKEELIKKYNEINKREINLVEELNKKYGIGTVDPKDWTFVPNK